MKITRALISVSNKKGVAAFARALEKQGVDIISTGGTAEAAAKLIMTAGMIQPGGNGEQQKKLAALAETARVARTVRAPTAVE